MLCSGRPTAVGVQRLCHHRPPSLLLPVGAMSGLGHANAGRGAVHSSCSERDAPLHAPTDSQRLARPVPLAARFTGRTAESQRPPAKRTAHDLTHVSRRITVQRGIAAASHPLWRTVLRCAPFFCCRLLRPLAECQRPMSGSVCVAEKTTARSCRAIMSTARTLRHLTHPYQTQPTILAPR